MSGSLHLENKGRDNRIRRYIWERIYFIFPSLQNFLLRTHLVWHDPRRQPFHIGWLARGETLTRLKKHLSEKWGFGNHFIAWKDTDQVLSWRRLENFTEQWHLRVYSDGEIRGHYERTPESNPIKHFVEVGEENRRTDFKKFLGMFCSQTRSPMHLTLDQTMTDPISEITTNGLFTVKHPSQQ